jgi:hypothetical protein
MLSKDRATPAYSPAPEAIPDRIRGSVSGGPAVASDPDVAPAQAHAATDREIRTRSLPPQDPTARARDRGRAPRRQRRASS